MGPVEFESAGQPSPVPRLSPARAIPALGERIRTERVRRGVGLRELAREVGVSASLVSQIETDKARPSVSTLYAITSALGVSVEDLLDPAWTVDGASETPSATGDPARRRRVGPVVHPADREEITLDSGVSWQLLGQVPGVHVDFLRVTYARGASSSSSGLQMRHPGTEYGYLVSGELVLTLAFEEYRLQAGDSVSFESTTPHTYRNEGTEPAVGIFFVTEH